MKHLLVFFKLSLYCLLVCFCFSNCRKNNNRKNIILYDKPLFVIQKYIQGNWKLIYGKGGIFVNTQYYYNNFWEFNDDRVKILDEGNVYADTTIYWNYGVGTYTNADSTFLMEFYDKENVPWVYVVERIYNDTLIIHDNSSDPYFYHFIKSD